MPVRSASPSIARTTSGTPISAGGSGCCALITRRADRSVQLPALLVDNGCDAEYRIRALVGLAHDAGGAEPMMPRAERLSPSISRRGLVLIAVGLLILIGIVIVAVAREATSRRVVAAALSRPAAPARPPLTPAEETYIQALWPIHGAVERSAVRMSLGQIFY